MHKIYLYTDQAASGLLSGFCLDESATTETVLTHSDVKKILLVGECDSELLLCWLSLHIYSLPAN
jgi:hypothetical protein